MILPDFILFALAAALFWSAGNVLDKSVLEDYITNPVVVTFFTGIFGVAFSIILPVLGYVQIPSLSVFTGSMLLGILYIAPVYLYMKSLTMEEVSRVVPIFSIAPVFVVIMGTLFLNEIFTLPKYVGIFLAITGSIIVSSKRFGKEFFHLQYNKAFWMIFFGTFLFAVYSVATRYLLNYADFWNIFFWSRMGALIPIVFFLLHKSTRNEIMSVLSTLRESKLEFLGISELLNNIAVLAQTVALSLGPATLVETATSAQSLFVLLFVGILKHVWDKDLGDDLSRKAVLIKTISALMIIAGIYLIR